jgi:hypothetical protein
VHVAVAELPVGEGVARHRLHLHVDGEEIVAGVAARACDLVHEHLGVEALAHEAAVVVGEARDHGLDLALRPPSRAALDVVACLSVCSSFSAGMNPKI